MNGYPDVYAYFQGNLSQLQCGGDKVHAIDANFAKLAAKGISVLFSSGDSGSGYDPRDHSCDVPDPAVDMPGLPGLAFAGEVHATRTNHHARTRTPDTHCTFLHRCRTTATIAHSDRRRHIADDSIAHNHPREPMRASVMRARRTKFSRRPSHSGTAQYTFVWRMRESRMKYTKRHLNGVNVDA
jgi:hypothetical protein